MQQVNEKLSMLIDDELEGRQAREVLDVMRKDQALQDKFKRYHLISQAIKNDSVATAAPDFLAGMQQRLRNEPIYLLPPKAPQKLEWQKTLGLAAAASVAMLAILVFANSEKHGPAYQRPQSMQLAQNRDPDNAKFKEYLQAHDNTWYAVNNAGVRQYARLAGYQQK